MLPKLPAPSLGLTSHAPCLLGAAPVFIAELACCRILGMAQEESKNPWRDLISFVASVALHVPLSNACHIATHPPCVMAKPSPEP